MSTTNRITFQVILPLLIGSIIYILFRSDRLIMFSWFNYLGLANAFNWCREMTFGQHSLPGWIIFSLPDALWVFSFTSLMIIIWNDNFSRSSTFWLLLAPAIGLFSEVGQMTKLVPGTFDQTDLSLILIASILPFLQILKKNKPEHT